MAKITNISDQLTPYTAEAISRSEEILEEGGWSRAEVIELLKVGALMMIADAIWELSKEE